MAVNAYEAWIDGGNRQEEKRLLHETIRSRILEAHGMSDNAIQKKLARLSGRKLRRRKSTMDDRNQVIYDIVAPLLAEARQSSTHSKGAGDTHNFGYRISDVKAILAALTTKEKFKAAGLALPSVHLVCQIFRDRGWHVQPRIEVTRYVQAMVGTNTGHAGQQIQMDATGLPIKVQRRIIDIAPGEKGNLRGYAKPILHVAVDPASGFMWNSRTFADNETDNWAPFLIHMLFNELKYAPETALVDRVSGVFQSLFNLDPNANKLRNAKIQIGAMAWIAAGVKVQLTTPEHAQAKGCVERANGIYKHDFFEQIDMRRRLDEAERGKLRAPRTYPDDIYAQRIVDEARAAFNAREFSRDGAVAGRPCELWQLPSAVAWRNSRLLASDARARWTAIAPRIQIGFLAGKYFTAKIGDRKAEAVIDGELPFEPQSEVRAILIPQGLLAADDPTKFRVIVLEERTLYRMHMLTAAPVARDEYGRSQRRPMHGGGFAALPDRAQDKIKKEQDRLATEQQRKWSELAGQTKRMEEALVESKETPEQRQKKIAI